MDLTHKNSTDWNSLPQEIYTESVKKTCRDNMLAFARINKENYKLYHGLINTYFPPTKHTLWQAIENGATYDTVISLINCFPETSFLSYFPEIQNTEYFPEIQNTEKYGNTKHRRLPFPDKYGSLLHFAICSESRIDVIEYLIDNDVGFAFDSEDNKHLVKTITIYDDNGDLPLYIAIRTARFTPRYSLLVITALLRAFPYSVLNDNQDAELYKMSPLHIAIDKYAGLEVIQALIACNGNVVKQKSFGPGHADIDDMNSDDGRVLPVHLAAENQTPLNVVRLLIQKYPESIAMIDFMWRRAPLHWALIGIRHRRNINEEDIDKIAYLLHKCPIVTTFVDLHNEFPIDIAIDTYEASEKAGEIFDSCILITLMRMYLNNTYPDENHIVKWEAGTAELKKNIRHHEFWPGHNFFHNHNLVVLLLEEIEEHEKLFKEDISKRTIRNSADVISRFKKYREEKQFFVLH